MMTETEPNSVTATGNTKAGIIVVDDHPLVREGLASLINRQSDMACCGSAENIPEAIRTIADLKPDLALVDLCLGKADGLDLVRTLRADLPGFRMLVISQMDETVYAERALRAGANGYVMKEQAAAELLKAIRTVLEGETYVSPRVAALAVRRMIAAKPASRGSNLDSLTEREMDVLKSLAARKSSRHIAAELNLSVKTIETYRQHLKYKLGLTSAAELTRFARNWSHNQTAAQTIPPHAHQPNPA